jgi:hypothetical protein
VSGGRGAAVLLRTAGTTPAGGGGWACAPAQDAPRLRGPRKKREAAPVQPRLPVLSGFSFASEVKPPAAAPKPKKAPRPRVKNDPRLVAAARELRDRWLEHVNADASALLTEAKYDVSRRIEGREAGPQRRLLAG